MFLLSIIAPFFVGFLIRAPQLLPVLDRVLNYLIYILLFFIGTSLAKTAGLESNLGFILQQGLLLAGCLIISTFMVLGIVDRTDRKFCNQRKIARYSMPAFAQILFQFAALILGAVISWQWRDLDLDLDKISGMFLSMLIFIVGIQIRSMDLSLKQALLNKTGVQVAVWSILASMLGAYFFALLTGTPIFKAMALSSGFGWYSLSGIILNQIYGPVWGSVAMLADLIRELSAFALIPFLMSRYSRIALGLAGSTSVDVTMPVIQASGGRMAVPIALSSGFIITILSPLMMSFLPLLG